VNPTWMKQGSCRGQAPDTFFPSDGVGVLRAQHICASCPVRVECLEHALANHIEHGVWGGASERQRQRLRRAHAQAQPEVRAS
jgi:WhiB family redox-sensing transcriptional regulator